MSKNLIVSLRQETRLRERPQCHPEHIGSACIASRAAPLDALTPVQPTTAHLRRCNGAAQQRIGREGPQCVSHTRKPVRKNMKISPSLPQYSRPLALVASSKVMTRGLRISNQAEPCVRMDKHALCHLI
jgi:hypothetical protein